MKVWLCLLLFVAAAQAQKLQIDVLYESLCPDSLRFIKNQLHPVWGEIAQYVNINFVPFGKSSSNGGTNFVCQHGPRECQGNKIQSCALYNMKDKNTQVEYVNCFMNVYMGSDSDLAQQCVLKAGLPWEAVERCYNSEVGTELQLLAEQETARISPRFIPTLLFNGVFDQRAQDDSQTNFRGVVCSILQQTNPLACK